MLSQLHYLLLDLVLLTIEANSLIVGAVLLLVPLNLRRYAMQVLRAMREQHPDAQAGTWVDPYMAAHVAGLNPDGLLYDPAIDYLVDEEAIEWVEGTAQAQTNPIYLITRRGLKMMREA
jgi:hypothetical protein